MEVVIYFCAHMTVLETTRWKEGGAFHHIFCFIQTIQTTNPHKQGQIKTTTKTTTTIPYFFVNLSPLIKDFCLQQTQLPTKGLN